MRTFNAILFVGLCLAVFGSGAAELSSAETTAARKIYIGKCAKCHELYDPTAYADADWAGWLKKMGKKSKLKPEQLELVVRYTDTLRPTGRPPKNP